MIQKGRIHSAAFKLKVALTAVREEHTLPQICQMYQLHRSVVSRWKKQLLEQGHRAFEEPSSTSGTSLLNEAEVAQLHQKIGELTVERDFLKKAWERLGLSKGGR